MHVDTIYRNGRLRVGDSAGAISDAIAVARGRVVALGAQTQMLTANRVIDLDGAPVLPGFHDAHFHLSGLGQSLQHCDVGPTAVANLDQLYAKLARFADARPLDAWVIAEGFDDAKLGGVPTRQALDAVTGGRPAWLLHKSHHAGVCNTAAIQRLGFSDPRDFPDVDGGVVGRDAEGAATGYLAERATQLLFAVLRPRPFAEFVEAIGMGSDAALAMGITSVSEPGISGALTGNGPDDYAAFERSLADGRLRVRTTVMPELAALRAGLTRESCVTHGDRLRLGAVKLFSDGALSARTAALTCDYLHPATAGRGLAFYDATELCDIVAELHQCGWQIAAHAIGDHAVDMVLDAYAQALEMHPQADARHRVEHAGLLNDQHIERMHSLGVIPVPQGRFIAEFADIYRDALGEDRAKQLFRQRSLLDAGLVVPGSSDCPVVNGAPILGIDALVNRSSADGSVLGADECISPAQAVRNFTYGSAYAEHAEHDRGSLEVGKLADFVVLTDDLLAIPPSAISRVQVVATIVGGTVEYGDLG